MEMMGKTVGVAGHFAIYVFGPLGGVGRNIVRPRGGAPPHKMS